MTLTYEENIRLDLMLKINEYAPYPVNYLQEKSTSELKNVVDMIYRITNLYPNISEPIFSQNQNFNAMMQTTFGRNFPYYMSDGSILKKEPKSIWNCAKHIIITKHGILLFHNMDGNHYSCEEFRLSRNKWSVKEYDYYDYIVNGFFNSTHLHVHNQGIDEEKRNIENHKKEIEKSENRISNYYEFKERLEKIGCFTHPKIKTDSEYDIEL